MKNFKLILIFTFAVSIGMAQEKHLSVRDTLPMFSLPDQDGKLFNYGDIKGKGILVIFFYPKDDANISTKQAVGFKETFKQFEEEGAIIIGINPGSIESHKAFHKKNDLPFPLLSDKDNIVVNQFGIKSTLGALNRETYIVDYTGKIVFHLDSYLDGAKHAQEALKYIQSE